MKKYIYYLLAIYQTVNNRYELKLFGSEIFSVFKKNNIFHLKKYLETCLYSIVIMIKCIILCILYIKVTYLYLCLIKVLMYLKCIKYCWLLYYSVCLSLYYINRVSSIFSKWKKLACFKKVLFVKQLVLLPHITVALKIFRKQHMIIYYVVRKC